MYSIPVLHSNIYTCTVSLYFILIHIHVHCTVSLYSFLMYIHTVSPYFILIYIIYLYSIPVLHSNIYTCTVSPYSILGYTSWLNVSSPRSIPQTVKAIIFAFPGSSGEFILTSSVKYIWLYMIPITAVYDKLSNIPWD